MAVFQDGKGNVKFKHVEAESVTVTGQVLTPGTTAGVLEYQVADLPAANTLPGRLVACPDGSAGNPCLAYSNGTKWLVVALGAEVSDS